MDSSHARVHAVFKVFCEELEREREEWLCADGVQTTPDASQDPEVLSAPPSPVESMSMGTPSPRHVPCGASRALAVPAETRRSESRSRSPKLLKEWDVRLIVRDELTRMLAEVKPPSPPQSGLAKQQPLNYLVPAKASQPPFGMFPLGAGKVSEPAGMNANNPHDLHLLKTADAVLQALDSCAAKLRDCKGNANANITFSFCPVPAIRTSHALHARVKAMGIKL